MSDLPSRDEILAYFKKFQWFERYPHDQYGRYEIESDEIDQSEVDGLHEILLDSTDPFWHSVDLYFLGTRVGKLRVDLRKMFDAKAEDLRRFRDAPDGTGRRLTDAEIEAPLTDPEAAKIVENLMAFMNELQHESEFLDEMFVNARLAKTVNTGPQGVLEILRQAGSIEHLRSRRLRSAIEAIVWANRFQAAISAAPADSAWRRRVEMEGPEKLIPVDVPTAAILKEVRRMLEQPGLPLEMGHRPADPQKLRGELRAARAFLKQFHQRASYFSVNVRAARDVLVAEFPEVIQRAGVKTFDSWLTDGPFDKSLEELALELVAQEQRPPISPGTVRSYARRSPEAIERRRRRRSRKRTERL